MKLVSDLGYTVEFKHDRVHINFVVRKVVLTWDDIYYLYHNFPNKTETPEPNPQA